MESELNKPPQWLPELIPLDGNSHENERRLMAVFEKDFFRGNLMIDGCNVLYARGQLEGDTASSAFRHLTTRDKPGKSQGSRKEREFDPQRAGRLAWVGAMIRNCSDPAVKRWEHLEADGRMRTYIWLEKQDFIVVLEQRTNNAGLLVYFLITAYFIDHEGSRRSYSRKYDQRVRSAGP